MGITETFGFWNSNHTSELVETDNPIYQDKFIKLWIISGRVTSNSFFSKTIGLLFIAIYFETLLIFFRGIPKIYLSIIFSGINIISKIL